MSELPLAQRLKQKRYYVTSRGEAMLVDDDGTCSTRHHPEGEIAGPWYRYQDTRGRRWPIICPCSLSESQKLGLILDEPRGALAIELAKRRAAARAPERKDENAF